MKSKCHELICILWKEAVIQTEKMTIEIFVKCFFLSYEDMKKKIYIYVS